MFAFYLLLAALLVDRRVSRLFKFLLLWNILKATLGTDALKISYSVLYLIKLYLGGLVTSLFLTNLFLGRYQCVLYYHGHYVNCFYGYIRSGNETEFSSMIQRCKKAGVGIVVDAVINHMAAGSGVGTAGSEYGSRNYPGMYA